MPARTVEAMTAHDADSNGEVPPAGVAGEEEVVISGISGRLPESDNMLELRQHLMNGVDMVTEDDRRWAPGLHGLPKRNGKLKEISKFDASFFGVHPKQAHAMDPQLRMLLEVTYEALVDAGVNPLSVRGTKTGVFIGCSASEAHEAWANDLEKVVGYEMTGCTRSMFANRLSYFFDFKGPSYAVDTACSSSLLALDQALQSIRLGLCDAAVVGGCNLCLKPTTTLQFQKLGMLSPEGACKSFDASGNGYCRSEAIVAVYLQKYTEAKRIYATVVHSKNNADGSKDQGITFPSGEVQKRLLTEVYSEAGVDPAVVSFVEAHGTGTKVGDPQEVNSIAEVFCKKGRQGPLLIGSTKSNMGHPETASGLAALAKVLIAMEEKTIPGNLHYNTPNPDIPGLVDGRLQVVVEPTKWRGGYVGINSFGFGGSNVHTLLKSNQREPNHNHPAARCQRLFTFSGRTQEGLEYTLDRVQERSINVEVQALLQENAATLPSSHPYRGYALLNNQNKLKDCQKCVSEERPVWFVFAGMGTQWHGMGRDLMSIDVYRDSIMKSDAVLRQHGLALYDMLMKGDETTFDDILNSFVAIAAIQVALVDTLTYVGIKPDGIVGHSVGELGCAYADGGLTAEETVLAAYWRGRCVLEANLPPGGMAAVGLTWEETKERCPEGVVPACHNSQDTVTVSGTAEGVSQFVEQLKKDGVFAKEVKSAGVAFHSHYIAKAAPSLRNALLKVMKEPRLRTKRWVSSSIPEDRWGSDLAQYSSASYHVNNLVSPVLFQEALQHVPSNAVTIEIAPHCLLQAILKRSLGPDCTFVGLMKRDHPDNMEFLLSSLGKVYMAGVNFNPMKLFPSVDFPVSPGTPMVSPFVKWDHSDTWNVPKIAQFTAKNGGANGSVTFEINTSAESEDSYLVGHVIDGRVLFPATGYLLIAWRTLAMQQGELYTQMPVAFENVHIYRATILPSSGTVKFDVTITPGTGQFEVCENEAVVASGRIFRPADDVILQLPASLPDSRSEDFLDLSGADVYRELRLRGYDYGPSFQGILSTNNTGDRGTLSWEGNWVSFIDTMLQIQVLGLPGRSLRLPTRIKALRIDPATHLERIIQSDNHQGIITAGDFLTEVEVIVDRMLDTCVAGGVEILGLHASVAPRRQGQQAEATLEEMHFIPYVEKDLSCQKIDLLDYLTACQSYLRQRLKSVLDNGLSDKGPNFTELKSLILKDDGEILNDLSKYCEDSNPSCTMLGVLQEALKVKPGENLISHARTTFKDQREKLLQDKLLKNLLEERTLKTCLDIVTENATTSKLKVVEYGKGDGEIFRHILSQLSTQPLLQVEYVIVGSDVISGDINGLEEFGVKTVQWNLQDSPPNHVLSADLVVISNGVHKERNLTETLNRLSLLLKDGGFMLLHEPTCNFTIPLTLFSFKNDISTDHYLDSRTCGPFCNDKAWCQIFINTGLEVIAQKSDGLMHSLFLCRKCRRPDVTCNQTVIDVTDDNFRWVDKVKEAMCSVQAQTPPDTIVLKAECEQPSGLIGMVNCLRQEEGGERIRCVFRSDLAEGHDVKKEEILDPQLLDRKDLVMNVFRDGQWGSFRHIPLCNGHADGAVQTAHAYVNVLTRGDLSSLRWIESSLKYHNADDHQRALCTTHYCSLNFRDVMLATGKLPPDAIPGDLANQDCILGMEFSGKDEDGKRVMGLLPAKGLATMVDADRRFLWPVPDRWTLEEAATIPVVYATAYYALVVRGRIQTGDRVLIHSGSGGVGQAAIAVALHYGCEVYTTVGSAKKKQFLIERFPLLSEDNFANSRENSFEWDLLRATKGKGFNVVLNSLAEEKLQASLRLLAPHGRFLEIGKFDLSNNTPLGMSIFLRNITFHGILLDALFEEGNREWEDVSTLMSRGIAEGAVRPLSATVFDKDDIESAFRFMAQGKHIGKVVVKIRPDDTTLLRPDPMKIAAIAKTFCHPRKTYVITGGLGGFGMELAHWLIERGARNLILTSRSGVRTGYQSRCMRLWHQAGINVTVSRRNVSVLAETEELLKEAIKQGPLGGVFHLAAVLRDGLMENQTVENFIKVAEPKVNGTVNLDLVSRQMCDQTLDWFVVFSSVSCGRGNAGQANYGYANSLMERVCERRKQDGLAGLAIQWGAIGDVGLVVDMAGTNDTVIGGTLPQRVTSCLNTLDHFLNQSHPVVSSFVLAERKSKTDTSNQTGLVDAVAHILGVKDVNTLAPDVTLAELGLDSLMGVEVRQTLERNFDLALSMKEIRLLTINRLHELAGSESTPNDHSKPETEVTSTAEHSATPTPGNSPVKYNISRIIPMDTIVKMTSDARHADGRPLFVVHPIEGTVISLRNLMSKVKTDVYGLQCTQDAPVTSLPDLASFYLSKIKDIQNTGPYQLAGYSFGACVAFEMALQLQHRDELIASLTLLDGSHSYVAAHTQQYKSRIIPGDMAHAETEALCTFVRQFIEIDYSQFFAQLMEQPDWASRAKFAVDHLTARTGMGSRSTELEAAARSFFDKVIIADSYKPGQAMNCDVTLIRTNDGQNLADLGHDYGLNKVCSRPVTVHVMEGDHESFILGDCAAAVAEIINSQQ